MAMTTEPTDTVTTDTIDNIPEASVSDDKQLAVVQAQNLLQQAADEKGARVGLEAGSVKVMKIDWARLLKSSFAVDTHVHGATFETVLDPEEFGIKVADEQAREAWRRNIRLGSIGTMPEKIRNRATSLKGRIGSHTRKYANETTFGKLIYLHPADPVHSKEEGWNFKEWLDGANSIVKKYNELRDYIVEHWDELMAQMRGEYQLIGVDVYARLKQAGESVPPLEEFLDEFVNRRMARVVHNRDSIKYGMRMEIDVRDVALAEALAQDQAAAEKVLLERDKVESERRIITEIERLKLETVRRDLKDGVSTLLAELRANTHGMLYDVCRKVLKAIQDNGEVPGGSVKGLRNLVDNLQNLEMVPDEKLDAQVEKVRKMLNRGSLNDNVNEVRTTMRQITAYALLTLKELDRTPEKSAREVGVPETMVGLQKVLGMQRDATETRQFDIDLPDMQPVAASTEARDF